jgi:thioredoxin reductase (NADPH)
MAFQFSFKAEVPKASERSREAYQKLWDIAIVGCGIAGITAAIYSARYGLQTAVICDVRCGTLDTIEIIENYPGFPRISGPELCQRLMEHLQAYDVPIIEDRVLELRKTSDGSFELKASGGTLKAKAVIVASGSKRRKLGVPGEELPGVSYCATCDAPLFKGKVVAVVGGGNTAAHEALVLSEHAAKVYIVHRRDKLKAEEALVKLLRQRPNVEFIYNAQVLRIEGDKRVQTLVYRDKVTGEERRLPVDGVLVAIGLQPNTEFLRGSGVELTESGHIKVDECMRTNVPGLFAAGDVTTGSCKVEQLTTAAAEGTIAATAAYSYLTKELKS